MKIIMILATGTLLTFTVDKRTNPDCFTNGYEILEKLATYRNLGLDQGWYLKDSKMQVGGWYCE
jgi:hypothetical protein